MLFKMTDIEEKIKASLGMVPGITYAFVYGPSAKNLRDEHGSIDVMVVGGPDLQEMEEIITKAEREVGRAVSITSLTLKEFQERIKVKDDLVGNALQAPKVMLIGSEKEMMKQGRRASSVI